MTWYRYARWEDVAKWEALGWAFHADLGLPHALYSCLMIWQGEGEPARSDENDLPDWEDLRGCAPNATGNLSSEDFVRNLRDQWA